MPGQPEFLPGRPEQHRVVFKNRDAHVGERAAHACKIVPPIVIAEDRPDAERRAKPRQLGRPQRIVDRLDLELVPRLEIAEQHDEVGLQRVRGVDNVRDVRQRHVRAAGMQVGDHRDGELPSRGPARRRQRVARDQKIGRLDRAGIGAGRARRQADQSDAADEEPPPAQAGFPRRQRRQRRLRLRRRRWNWWSLVLHEHPLTPTRERAVAAARNLHFVRQSIAAFATNYDGFWTDSARATDAAKRCGTFASRIRELLARRPNRASCRARG